MPAIPAPQPGLVIRYDYLWTSDAAAGRQLGKDRPACIIVVLDRPNLPQFAAILPITHTRPTGADGIEIPQKTLQRLGLDDQPSWVKTSEYNIEIWPPPGLARIPGRNSFTYGLLPPALFDQIRAAFQAALAAGLARQVSRNKP